MTKRSFSLLLQDPGNGPRILCKGNQGIDYLELTEAKASAGVSLVSDFLRKFHYSFDLPSLPPRSLPLPIEAAHDPSNGSLRQPVACRLMGIGLANKAAKGDFSSVGFGTVGTSCTRTRSVGVIPSRARQLIICEVSPVEIAS